MAQSEKTNVIKVQFMGRYGKPYGREYTYYPPEPVEAGDRVSVETERGVSEAVVTQVNVPVGEIARFGDKARTIIGKVKEDAKPSPPPELTLTETAEGQQSLPLPAPARTPWD